MGRQTGFIEKVKGFYKRVEYALGSKKLNLRYIALLIAIIYLPITLGTSMICGSLVDMGRKDKIKDVNTIFDEYVNTMNINIRNTQQNVDEFANMNGLKTGIQKFNQLKPYNQGFLMYDYAKRKLLEIKEKDDSLEGFIIVLKEQQLPFLYFVEYEFDVEKFMDFIEENPQSGSFWKYAKDSEFLKDPIPKEIIYSIKNIEGYDGEVIGYLVSIMKKERVLKIKEDKYLEKYINTYIYDENLGEFISQKDEYINFFNDNSDLIQENKLVKTKYKGKEIAIVERSVENMNWKMVGVIEIDLLAKDISKNVKKLMYIIAFIGIVSAVFIAGTVIVVSLLITDKEIANHKLELTQEMNEKFRIYRHDFMNHLQIIKGLLELGHGEKAMAYLDKVGVEGKTIFKKYEIGIPELESTIFSHTANASAMGIETKTGFIEIDKEKIDADIYDLSKILNNLLKNAIEALAEVDGEKILSVLVYQDLENYIFEVVNNRPVIGEELRERMFEKGYTTKATGSGLGTHIIMKLVEKNKGTMNLTVDEQGNHFIVKFKKI